MSSSVIVVLNKIFARYGTPEIFHSDNGPQYDSDEFAKFMEFLHICHITSSPYYPQSNGQSDKIVQTVKRRLKHSESPFLALLTYRVTPLPWFNLSPAELLMGRRLRTIVPQTDNPLIQKWSFLLQFKRLNAEFKD